MAWQLIPSRTNDSQTQLLFLNITSQPLVVLRASATAALFFLFVSSRSSLCRRALSLCLSCAATAASLSYTWMKEGFVCVGGSVIFYACGKLNVADSFSIQASIIAPPYLLHADSCPRISCHRWLLSIAGVLQVTIMRVAQEEEW